MFKGYKKLGEIIQDKRKKYFYDVEDFYAGIEEYFGKKSFLRKKNKKSCINFSLNTYKRIEKGQIHTVGEKTIEQISEFLSFIQIKKQEKDFISSYQDFKLEEPFQNIFHEFKNEFYKAMREDENPLFTDLSKYIGNYFKLSFSVKNSQKISVSKLKIEFSPHDTNFSNLKVFIKEYNQYYEGFVEKINDIISINAENINKSKKVFMMFQILDENISHLMSGLETSFNSNMEIFSKKTVLIKYNEEDSQFLDIEKIYDLNEIYKLIYKNNLYKIDFKQYLTQIFFKESLSPGILVCRKKPLIPRPVLDVTEQERLAYSLTEISQGKEPTYSLTQSEYQHVESLFEALNSGQKKSAFNLSQGFFEAVLEPMKVIAAYFQVADLDLPANANYRIVMDWLKDRYGRVRPDSFPVLPLGEAVMLLVLAVTQTDKESISHTYLQLINGKEQKCVKTYPLNQSLIKDFIAPFGHLDGILANFVIFHDNVVIGNPAVIIAHNHEKKREKYLKDFHLWSEYENLKEKAARDLLAEHRHALLKLDKQKGSKLLNSTVSVQPDLDNPTEEKTVSGFLQQRVTRYAQMMAAQKEVAISETREKDGKIYIKFEDGEEYMFAESEEDEWGVSSEKISEAKKKIEPHKKKFA